MINASELHDERFRRGEREDEGDDDDEGEGDDEGDEEDEDGDGKEGGEDDEDDAAARSSNGLCHSMVMFSTRKIFWRVSH